MNQRTLSERIYSPSPLTTRTLLQANSPGYAEAGNLCQYNPGQLDRFEAFFSTKMQESINARDKQGKYRLDTAP